MAANHSYLIGTIEKNIILKYIFENDLSHYDNYQRICRFFELNENQFESDIRLHYQLANLILEKPSKPEELFNLSVLQKIIQIAGYSSSLCFLSAENESMPRGVSNLSTEFVGSHLLITKSIM